MAAWAALGGYILFFMDLLFWLYWLFRISHENFHPWMPQNRLKLLSQGNHGSKFKVFGDTPYNCVKRAVICAKYISGRSKS